jgi:predicted AlkP superfamily pyrophosphatase or phosphodiesterase
MNASPSVKMRERRIQKGISLRRFARIERWLCALILIVLGVSAFDHAKVQKKPIVVVISLDGFPAYALDDPRLPIPTLRRLAREGAIAASMQPINPTVTWPNHTAMVTGVDASEHQVLFNGLLTHPNHEAPPTIEPWRDKDQMVHAPTIYDVAHQAGLTTAQVDWVAIYHAKSIDWQFPELPNPNGEIERKLISAGTVTAEQLRKFEDSSQAWQDLMWTNAAVEILQGHEPNLLLFHLLTLDDTNHEYGPMTNASFTAMAFLDAQVKRIVDVLERSDLANRATLIIVSDHGFRAFQHKVHPNVLLQEKGLVTSNQGKVKADAWVVPEGGTAMVYVTNPNRKAELLPQLRTLLATAEGVEQVYGSDDFSKLGLPTPDRSDQAPDLLLAAKPGYAFAGELEGDMVTTATGGTHGYLNTDPKMQAIFIAWGRDIPKGVRLDRISNLDVAPTIAMLLNFKMPQAKGQPIPEIARHGSVH